MVNKDNKIIYLFGGAGLNGRVCSNTLYYLHFSKGIENGEWGMLKFEANKPPKRYGHNMIYSKPHLIIFGGTSEDNKSLNDVWIINIDEYKDLKVEWTEVKFDGIIPSPRTYSSSCICKSGRAKGMILFFGGRGIRKEIYNDLWGLRKHRNGNWEWVFKF